MIAALLLALALPVHAQSPEAVVSRVMTRVETLVAAQKGKDAREIRDLDRQAEALSKDLAPLGWKAVPALSAAAQDLKRPAKERLFAVTFLALTRDPAALPPLEDILLDPKQDAITRALAAQSLPGLRAPASAVQSALCSALALPDLPQDVAVEALIPLERLGCPDPSALTRLIRAHGPRPEGVDLRVTLAALTVLGRSRGTESARAILAQVEYFPALGEARAGAVKALYARRKDLSLWLKPEALPVVVSALRSESPRWDTMLPLIRTAVALGPLAAPALDRLASHADAEVLAEAAEALVVFKRIETIPVLETVVAGALHDPRFSPQDGRPEPAASLARIEKAVAALRRSRE